MLVCRLVYAGIRRWDAEIKMQQSYSEIKTHVTNKKTIITTGIKEEIWAIRTVTFLSTGFPAERAAVIICQQ